jgi:hypothetical protein
MDRLLAFAAVLTLSIAVGASAQVRGPISSAAVARQPISDAQARQLSESLEQRASSAVLTLNADALREIAAAQGPAVEVRGANVFAAPSAAENAVVSAPAPSNFGRVELVSTTARDEILLKGAIAAQEALQPALSVEGSSLITLPGLVRMASTAEPDLQLKPFILVNQPLQRNAAGNFEGELLIGVTEIVDSGMTRRLPTPLLFQIVGAVRSIPEKVLVDTTSPPFRKVRVIVDAIQDKVAKLRIVSVIDRAGTEVTLPLAGELNVDTESGSIEGFGLETTTIHVSATALPNAKGRLVALRVNPSGYLQEGALELDANGNAKTVLRSDGFGKAQIRATSPELKTAVSEIDFRFPYRTLAASIVGGLLGALASFMTTPQKQRRPIMRIGGGALFGVLVFLAYAVGVNILPIQPKVTVGSIVVMAVSGFGAWLGPKVLHARIFGSG